MTLFCGFFISRRIIAFIGVSFIFVMGIVRVCFADPPDGSVLNETMLSATELESDSLPRPDLSTAFSGSQSYDKTVRAYCYGEDLVGSSMANMSWKQRARIRAHKGPGHVSVQISDEDIGIIDSIQLSDQKRSNLRYLLRYRARRLELSNDTAEWTFDTASGVSALNAKEIKWSFKTIRDLKKIVKLGPITILGLFADAVTKRSNALKEQLSLIADQLRSETVAYRSFVSILSKDNHKYIRIRYALYPADRSLIVVQTCYLVRTPI